MKITVIGSGRWGTFLAWYTARLGHAVKLYGREQSKAFEQLKQTRQNDYLALPMSVELTTHFEEALSHGEIIIISIGAQNLRQLAKQLSEKCLTGKTFVLCMKGLEASTGKRLTTVFKEEITQAINLGVWLGPGHVQDFVRNISNCMVIDSDQTEIIAHLIDVFNGDTIRFYYGRDLIGNEIGAAAKNVVGIAAGMLDGIGHDSLKGALMARGTKEVGRLIEAMGGNALSAYGLCHLGDYQATLFSPHSHNRYFGEQFVRHRSFEKLAEGVETSRALKKLAAKCNVEMPINNAIYAMLFEKANAKQMLEDLFTRSSKTEF
jgi:glycerol-3-phosphate dehydrogenase (NAD(P)+)